MIAEKLYVKRFDDIDTVNLPEGEVKARKIAKSVSYFTTLIAYYLIIFPVLGVVYILNRKFAEAMNNLTIFFILKTNRWIWYQMVYYPLKLVFNR